MDTKKYENKTIELTGFVFRDKDFNDTSFIAARSLITCCAADTSIVGLICEYNDGKQLKNDTWIKVKGKIKDTSFNGQQMPMIVVEKCEEIEKPKNEYIYP
jgi:putative membrane protein